MSSLITFLCRATEQEVLQFALLQQELAKFQKYETIKNEINELLKRYE